MQEVPTTFRNLYTHGLTVSRRSRPLCSKFLDARYYGRGAFLIFQIQFQLTAEFHPGSSVSRDVVEFAGSERLTLRVRLRNVKAVHGACPKKTDLSFQKRHTPVIGTQFEAPPNRGGET